MNLLKTYGCFSLSNAASCHDMLIIQCALNEAGALIQPLRAASAVLKKGIKKNALHKRQKGQKLAEVQT